MLGPRLSPPIQAYPQLAAFGAPHLPLLSVPISLSISIVITLEFSPFYLSNQRRTCLSPPRSTALLLCLLQPGAWRGGSSLSGNYDSFPSSSRKSLFFSLNVQVNFYRLFIQPLYWLTCYLLRKCSPQRERVGTHSNSLGPEEKTLQRVRGRGRNSEGTPGNEGHCGGAGAGKEPWAGAGQLSALLFGLASQCSSLPCKSACMQVHMDTYARGVIIRTCIYRQEAVSSHNALPDSLLFC